jgi:hypothetical protein
MKACYFGGQEWEALPPKWGTLGRAQDRASAARRNDVLVKGALGPHPIIFNRTAFLPIQFVEVVTTVWYSQTYSFVML